MATGLARGAAKRNKLVAFGDGKTIRWDQYSAPIFSGNLNIARPGQEHKPNLEWVPYYKGHRIYNSQGDNRWIWNYDFKAIPGEIFLTAEERFSATPYRKGGLVIIEPNVPEWKTVAPNKRWPPERYNMVASKLRSQGYNVIQLWYGRGHKLSDAVFAPTQTFRHALAVMSKASLYIGPEGGLHHAAAAFGVPGVVLFGGFIPPAVTGYDIHTNLTGGAEACGSFGSCPHCKAAMDAISADEVYWSAIDHLKAEGAS